MEYTFPAEGLPAEVSAQAGIKYSLILRPGADFSVVKIKYDGLEKIKTDTKENIIITSSFGDLASRCAPKLPAIGDEGLLVCW